MPPLIAADGPAGAAGAVLWLASGLPRSPSASIAVCRGMPQAPALALCTALQARTDWRVRWAQDGQRMMRRPIHAVAPGRVARLEGDGNFRRLPQSAPAQQRMARPLGTRVRPASRSTAAAATLIHAPDAMARCRGRPAPGDPETRSQRARP
ncbi:MAG: hypothetical protein KIT60_13465 [Burkholderiaceae bacterium]|nr:hypothetical protein [Burkholderiaceae bacterium]